MTELVRRVGRSTGQLSRPEPSGTSSILSCHCPQTPTPGLLIKKPARTACKDCGECLRLGLPAFGSQGVDSPREGKERCGCFHRFVLLSAHTHTHTQTCGLIAHLNLLERRGRICEEILGTREANASWSEHEASPCDCGGIGSSVGSFYLIPAGTHPAAF